jgi:DNA polymerase-3 subunit gamma/tau
LVLYRKYRPQAFSEIVGQEHIVQTLSNAITMGLISHAYLFSGPRGSGKTTLARILAKAVNCQDRKSFEPCNKCFSCQEIMEGRAIDLIEIDAASNRGIDDVRELREGIRFSPTRLKYKVFIVDECHQLSREAANALLKTLEEPPPHAIFILATTEIQKMIPTIISRCQRFDFRRLRISEIVARLELLAKNEKVKIEKPALELIALNSGGSLRDAEGLLDQAITFSGTLHKEKIEAEDIKNILGIVDTNLVKELIDLILEKKTAQALYFLNETLERGCDPQEFIKTLIRYVRQALIFKISPNFINPALSGLTKEGQEKLMAQTMHFKEADLRRILNLFLEAENKMKYSSIPQLPLELAIIEALAGLQNEEK